MKEEIFALDIGTRKVMGIVARREEDHLEILDAEMMEHPARPMFDGQIHSIDEVAKTVKKIKEKLESRLGKKLDKAGVAVAGRNLITYKSSALRDFVQPEEVTEELIRTLELEAVDKISCDSGNDLSEFYCVGYSPVYYQLDNNRISSPVGHRAKSVAIEVIVTFLPRIVLDSIFAVLRKSRIEAINLTLEPIAAMKAIIPLEMRRLNIILVDIGAGTSDIAISRDGVVFAYGMVPEAGDEITEAISHQLLVDFSTAEKIKRALDTNDQVEYEDIWSRKHRINTRDAKFLLSDAVKKLGNAIAKTGLELNGSVPSAIVLVGGGAQTTGLIDALALSFNMARDKIGIRLPAMIDALKDSVKKLIGPEAVTPIGIAMMTDKSEGLRFIEVEVNKEKVILLDFAQKKDILGALTFSGAINGKRLYPRPGLALTVKLNGELKIIKGTFGSQAKINLNGSPVSGLSEKINHGDKIEFEEAINGQDARATVADIVKSEPVGISFNGQQRQYCAEILMDDRPVRSNAEVLDRANIAVLPLRVLDVLKSENVDLEVLSERQVLINIDGVPKILPQRNFTLLINGKFAELGTELNQNDIIEFSPATPTHYRVRDVVDTLAGFEKMHISVDNRDIEVTIERVQVFMNGQHVSPDEFLIDGADVRVYHIKERKVLLSEIFKYIEIDPKKVAGKRMRIMVNDAPAGFTTPLEDGSRVKLLFEER
jgi:cell division protein FtsA